MTTSPIRSFEKSVEENIKGMQINAEKTPNTEVRKPQTHFDILEIWVHNDYLFQWSTVLYDNTICIDIEEDLFIFGKLHPGLAG